MSQEVKYFVGFNGHGHSGHTLIAAILDAHPQIAMANTYGRYDSVGDVIEAAKKPLWDGPKYDFTMAGAQGDVENVTVVGHTTLNPTDDFGLASLRIGTIRNPYDVVAAQAVKFQNRCSHPMRAAIDYYFKHLESLVKSDLFIWLDTAWGVKYYLPHICNYLDVECENSWLRSAQNMVTFPSVRKHEVEWDIGSRTMLEELIHQRWPVLFGRYRLED